MKINKKQFHKWIVALRSGEYKQTKNRLQDKKGYCCLGVACKVLIPENKQELYNVNKFLDGHIPSDQKYAPKWLNGINSDFNDKVLNNKYGYGKLLTELNDDENMSFNEIADCLELVYIHKILG